VRRMSCLPASRRCGRKPSARATARATTSLRGLHHEADLKSMGGSGGRSSAVSM
jgi:hypothetical protein